MKTVKYFVSIGASVASESYSCVNIAIQNGRTEFLEFFASVSGGAKEHIKNSLNIAVMYNKIKVVKLCVLYGTNIKTYCDDDAIFRKTHGYYGLGNCLCYGYFKIAKYLMSQGAEIGYVSDEIIAKLYESGEFDILYEIFKENKSEKFESMAEQVIKIHNGLLNNKITFECTFSDIVFV